MSRRNRGNDNDAFFVILGIALAIAGVSTAVGWLLDQWWFVPSLIIGGLIILAGFVYWLVTSIRG